MAQSGTIGRCDIDLTERPQNREDLAKWYEAALIKQESSGLLG